MPIAVSEKNVLSFIIIFGTLSFPTGQSSRQHNAVIFGDTQISLIHSVGWVEGGLQAKNQLDPFIRFGSTPTCDRQTQTAGDS